MRLTATSYCKINFQPQNTFRVPGPSNAAWDLAWSYARGEARHELGTSGYCVHMVSCTSYAVMFSKRGHLYSFLIYTTKFMRFSGAFDFTFFVHNHTQITKEACTEIIKRACSIMEYDLRDNRLAETPDLYICPVLRDLHAADLNHSESGR